MDVVFKQTYSAIINKEKIPKGTIFMIKADSTVIKETKYIAYFSLILSVLMQAVFLVLRRWDYTVLLGNLLSFTIAVLNFYFMGISVQKALAMEDADARKVMRASQGLRNVAIFLAIVIGVVAPCFNNIAVILPVFFPRVAVSFRPYIKDNNKKEVTDE